MKIPTAKRKTAAKPQYIPPPPPAAAAAASAAAAAALPATVTAQIRSKYQYMGLDSGFRVRHDVSEMR